MNTLEFLQRVLPTEGYYVTTVINPDGRRQGFFETVEQLAKAVAGLDAQGNNTYYAISAFVEKGNRKQENVRATKVLALDIDCGETKPFADWKEGLKALGVFIAALGLPKPMVIASGNGLHVYWVLTRELAPDEWKPLAMALKTATIAKEFEVDSGLTANSALVLRPIGTRNPKNGNIVKLLIDAEPVDPSTMASCLSSYMVAHQMSQSSSTRSSTLLDNLAVKQDFPPSISHLIVSKCQQVKFLVENQADKSKVPEPLWYNLMGIAAYCVEPEATAIEWSRKHPDFNQTATISKMEQWKEKGFPPTTCDKFDTDRPGGCKGCKYKGSIGSPTRLGIQYQEVAPPIVDSPTAQAAASIPLPRPFLRTVAGIKMRIDDVDVDVCRFDIYPVSYGLDESLGYETVRYMWNRPHIGWKELSLRQAYLTHSRLKDFVTAIADQGIVLQTDKQTETFQYMLRSYMDELRQLRTTTNLYSTMGWKEDFTQFVLGDRLFRRNPDGTVSEESITLAAGSQRVSNDLYPAKGDLEAWTNFSALLERADMRPHMFTLGVSFSSVLYAFTGLNGLTISLYGPTGGGKSLAQLWQQSVWGDPTKLHFAAKFTQNTLFSRMGLYAHLPMSIDEVTMVPDKDVGDFLYWVTQGRDKARLNRNAEERDARTWQMPVTVSTNKSWQSKLIASGLETDAQMARLLEFNFPVHPLFNSPDAGRKIHGFLTTNFGTAGPVIIKHLLELGEQGIRAMIDAHREEFYKKYRAKFTGEERFWELGILLSDLGNNLAHRLGIIKYDYAKGTEHVLSQVGAIRRSITDNKADCFDLLSDYLNENVDATLSIMHTVGSKPTMDFSRMPRNGIRVRFDTYRQSVTSSFDKGTVMIERTAFRKWLATRGADWKTFNHDLTEQGASATPKSMKAYLGKDSPIKLPQSYVVGITLTHPRTIGVLSDIDEAVDNLTLGKIAVVK